jgi:hypothetical protein
MVNPSLIHSNKLMDKISFIFVKMLQALFRDFRARVLNSAAHFFIAENETEESQ